MTHLYCRQPHLLLLLLLLLLQEQRWVEWFFAGQLAVCVWCLYATIMSAFTRSQAFFFAFLWTIFQLWMYTCILIVCVCVCVCVFARARVRVYVCCVRRCVRERERERESERAREREQCWMSVYTQICRQGIFVFVFHPHPLYPVLTPDRAAMLKFSDLFFNFSLQPERAAMLLAESFLEVGVRTWKRLV